VIRYVDGDATQPQQLPVIIAHSCNDVGRWGAGFSGSLSRRWKQPEGAYRALTVAERQLGTVEFVPVDPQITVANMVAQHGIGRGRQRVDYSALRQCLAAVAIAAQAQGRVVVCPRIGAGLGGGSWPVIEALILETGAEFHVYERRWTP
jgi:O-acetyl-ADP-ribose deacetylase (regulator of RNase III)